jgi:hypothetical protein
MRKRVNACIAECGEHFQHLISLFFVFWFEFLIEHVSGIGCVTFQSLHIY